MKLIGDGGSLPVAYRRHVDVALPELGEDMGVRLWGPSAAMTRALLAYSKAHEKDEQDQRVIAVALCAGREDGGLLFASLGPDGALNVSPQAFVVLGELDNALLQRIYDVAAELIFGATVEKAKGES